MKLQGIRRCLGSFVPRHRNLGDFLIVEVCPMYAFVPYRLVLCRISRVPAADRPPARRHRAAQDITARMRLGLTTDQEVGCSSRPGRADENPCASRGYCPSGRRAGEPWSALVRIWSAGVGRRCLIELAGHLPRLFLRAQ